MARFLEDYTVGSSDEFGSITVTAEEIVAFAERYDPQPFHVDAEAAKNWPFGGLIASGWHTCAMMMRLMVDRCIDGTTSLGSPGLGPIAWKVPVRPGDVLRVRVRVVDAKRSRSKPDRGAVTFEADVLNQHDEIVMTVEHWVGIVRARDAAG
ncbi:MAG TPA: MaoC family dehydratase [Candidatus Baltobacteraceae bacterium]|nr:MaoC family dehydratase [Candidatus Baltobacteraceae bacterium]